MCDEERNPVTQAEGAGVKRALRRRYIEERTLLSDTVRQSANERICRHLMSFFSMSDLRSMFQERLTTIGLYRAFRGEVNVLPLAVSLRKAGWTTAFPVANPSDKTMTFKSAGDQTDWVEGSYGIWEPGPAAPKMDIETLVALIVPGVAFTRDGGRLGYGGGYYDRLFAVIKPEVLRIGAAFSCQLAESLHVEPHDVRMHYVVTEDGVIPCSSKHSY